MLSSIYVPEDVDEAALSVPARQMRMNEVACTATLDGEPAIAHIEIGWPKSYIKDFTG